MNALSYIIDLVFDLYLMIIILRVWLQLAKADFYNQLSQFVVKATNPILVPLRRIIPGVLGIDMAGVLLAITVAGAKFGILSLIAGSAIELPVLPLLALILVVKKVGFMIFFIMIIRAILSWVSQGGHPIEYLMAQLTDPLLKPIRRIIPSIGGIDLSMIVMFVGLNFINILFSQYIPYWSVL